MEVNPQFLPSRIYSNQRCQCCLQGQWQKGLSASNWKKLLFATMRRSSFRSEFSCLLRRGKSWWIFLKKNIDVFAWSTYNAPGVDPNFICHHLNVNPSTIPKKQPPQCSFREHSDVVKGEVLKLKRAGAMKEVFYPEWPANTMKWRKENCEAASMCGLYRFK